MSSKKRITQLDGLRGFACLLIYFSHSDYLLQLTNDGVDVLGKLMVALFLMISGFSLSYNYDGATENVSFVAFIKKRYFKIMPLYWITDLACFGMGFASLLLIGSGYILDVPANFTLSSVVLEVLGINYVVGGVFPFNAPLWTISYLIVCYIIFYALFIRLHKNENAYLLTLVLMIIFLLYRHIQGEILAFLVGMITYEVYTRISDRAGFYISLASFLALLISISGVIGSGELLTGFIGNNVREMSVVFSTMILVFALYLKPITVFMSVKPILFLGKISMSIYMWQWFCLTIFERSDFIGFRKTFAGMIISFVATIIVSLISYYWVEPKLKKIFQN